MRSELGRLCGLTRTVDPTTLRELARNGTQCPEETRAAARRLLSFHETALCVYKARVCSAQEAGDIPGIQYARAAYAERDAQWRVDGLRAMAMQIQADIMDHQGRLDAARAQWDSAKAWVSFWRWAQTAVREKDQELDRSWSKRWRQYCEIADDGSARSERALAKYDAAQARIRSAREGNTARARFARLRMEQAITREEQVREAMIQVTRFME